MLPNKFLLLASLPPILLTSAYVQPNQRNHVASKLAIEGKVYPEAPFFPDLLRVEESAWCSGPGPWQAWFRTAIYDALDYDAEAKTGGLDGSVFYEIDRYPPEIQKDIIQTAADIESLSSKYLSRADALAYAVSVFGVGCEYNLIRAPDFTFGRTDVYTASPPTAVNKTGLTDTELSNLSICSTRFTYYPLGPDGTSQFICPPLLKKILQMVPEKTVLTPSIDGWGDPEFFVNIAKLTIEDDQLYLSLRVRLGYGSSIYDEYTLVWCDRYGPNADCTSPSQPHSAIITTLSTDLSTSPGCTHVHTTTMATQYYVDDTAYACDFRIPIDPNLSVSKFWFKRLMYQSWTIEYNNTGNGYPIEQDVLVFMPELSEAKWDEANGANVLHLVVGIKNTTSITKASASYYDDAGLHIFSTNTSSPPTPSSPTELTSPLERNLTLGSSASTGYEFYSTHFVVEKRPSGTVDFTVEAGGETVTLRSVFAAHLNGYLGADRVNVPVISA